MKCDAIKNGKTICGNNKADVRHEEEYTKMRFSERIGIRPVTDVIQVDGMNHDLRAGLWNVLYAEEFGKNAFLNGSRNDNPRIYAFSRALWLTISNSPSMSDQDTRSRS